MSKATLLAFIAGAAVGSAATWLGAKEYFAKIAKEEVEETKEYYAQKYDSSPEKDCDDDPDDLRNSADAAKDKPNIMEYAAKLAKEGYTNYSNSEVRPTEKETPKLVDGARPYVISPDDFGEIEEYDKISLTYYADQVLADEDDEIVDDVEDAVTFDALGSFGTFENDSVHVRNDKRKCDFEILKDLRNYSDVVKTKPHPMEV